jgi:hypothetical protein
LLGVANFRGADQGEVPRTTLPRTPVNRDKQKGPGVSPGPKEMGTRRIGIAQYAAKVAAGFAQVMRQSGQINTTGR